MDPRLLEYYNRELSYLRETGAEFAARHPKVAARLGMQGTDIADPYVERMVEAFSFLSARTQLKIDAEFPRFTQRLAGSGQPQLRHPHALNERGAASSRSGRRQSGEGIHRPARHGLFFRHSGRRKYRLASFVAARM